MFRKKCGKIEWCQVGHNFFKENVSEVLNIFEYNQSDVDFVPNKDKISRALSNKNPGLKSLHLFYLSRKQFKNKLSDWV